MKPALWFFLCFLLGSLIYGQEWGKVSADELAMTGIKEDPEADAVILFDKGEIITTADLDMVFKRHCRIKILTEQGKEFADISIWYWYEDHVMKLEAQSFRSDGTKTKLPADAIFDQQREDFKFKTFAIPAVEVGSVIEYRFEIQSKYIHHLEPWFFQNEEYTKFSEIKVVLTEGLSFNAFRENMILYNPVKTEGTQWDLSRKGKRAMVYTWQLSDIPALKSEPYMYNQNDYRTYIHFQLVSYKDEYNNYTFIKTWDDMAKRMTNQFKQLLAPDEQVKNLATELVHADSSDISNIRALYDYVRTEIETEDYPYFYDPDYRKPARVLETKKGKPFEKNLLLINLLNNAGFHAYPVLISTRSNGKLRPEFATTRQFNHLLAAVSRGNELTVMDTRGKYCPYGLLPDNSAVPIGFFFEADTGGLINFPKINVPSGTDISSRVTLDENGNTVIESEIKYTGYTAVTERSTLDKTAVRDYLQEKLNDLFIGAQLDSFTISGLNNVYQPLFVHLHISIPDYIKNTDNLVYFSPPFLSRQKSNPFKTDKRNFPVDYPCTFSNVEKIKIKIPAGFTLNEVLPRAKTTFQGISFNLFALNIDNEIEIQRVFKLNKEVFPVIEYKNIRQVYDEMVSADQKQIVFNGK